MSLNRTVSLSSHILSSSLAGLGMIYHAVISSIADDLPIVASTLYTLGHILSYNKLMVVILSHYCCSCALLWSQTTVSYWHRGQYGNEKLDGMSLESSVLAVRKGWGSRPSCFKLSLL